ncbi:alpha/beta hydrolase fold protein [Xylariales sp. PMI_506]|nr:alpha/beta hydrolase fold protein [Xylariales sp. PMI_506]
MADSNLVHPRSPLSERLRCGATIMAIQTLAYPLRAAQRWQDWMWPTESSPNLIKSYDTAPGLPVRIFFPSDYDQTSPEELPLVLSVHGGGFCIGEPMDDDKWNRQFADTQRVLIVALNYSKAPAYPFPRAINDLEALALAVVGDASLPFDKSRIAFVGFSAGGNLSLAVCQLPSIRETVKPSAIIPIYAVFDRYSAESKKLEARHYKPELLPAARGKPTDFLAGMSSVFTWSYTPVGQNLRDPLLSPIEASRETLPQNIYIVSAELDQLAHEAWRTACRVAGRPEPSLEVKVGQPKPAAVQNKLILDDERFAFARDDDKEGSIRWLLVPDQIHGFDHIPQSWHASEEAFNDANVKTEQYQKLLGEWLHQTVWKD